MQALTPAAILHAWEAARNQHPVDRALTLLLAAEPGGTRARLAALSIAERDARLLQLRARTLGPVLAIFARCPACEEHLEFEVRTEALTGPVQLEEWWEIEAGPFRLRFRLPDSRDLAAAARCGNPSEARRLLASRCMLALTRQDGAASGEDLPEEAVAALAEAMARVAPQAESLFDLSCPACDRQWQEALDIGAFFWKELAALARRLMAEVDLLARTYHWSEAEILALSPARRQGYLQLVSQ
jgi:hypothetical protein